MSRANRVLPLANIRLSRRGEKSVQSCETACEPKLANDDGGMVWGRCPCTNCNTLLTLE
jgi:hypothetical protein